MSQSEAESLRRTLAARFSDAPEQMPKLPDGRPLTAMAGRGSARSFSEQPVERALLKVLSAVALSSPTKSDLQQRDIVFLDAPADIAALASLVPGQSWIAGAPVIAVFCGNNRRQRLIHEWQNVPFANDHLDAFFNAAVDAGVALSAFVTAAESQGLGVCPISAVRNAAQAVSDMLALPDHVFPVAGLAIGYPAAQPVISKRLPLGATCHFARYEEGNLRRAVEEYSPQRRYRQQRLEDVFGAAPDYGWAEDKTRQYSVAERADFGTFVRRKGFNLD